MTLNDLRADIRTTLNSLSGNSLIDNRQIDDLIAEKREKYIRREYNRNRNIDQSVIQDLGCIEIELVDRIQCGCYEIDSDCQILRSKLPIPRPIELYATNTITRVASLDILDLPVQYVSYDEAIYKGNGRFNRKSLVAFLKGDYMYFIPKSVNHTLIEKMNVQGIFSNPKDVSKFRNCDGQPCWHPDSPYPLTRWMWDIMQPEIIQDLLPIFQILPDSQNNGKDDTMLLNNIRPRKNEDEV
jgi:hypothetical protein